MASLRPLIAGNWKMNGLRDDALALAASLKARAAASAGFSCDILVCPPFTVLHEVARVLRDSPIRVGAQDCHEAPPGAHTGDIAAAMVKDAGCDFVIVGHSERRQNHGESDAVVRRKAMAALGCGLSVIVCVGETEAERDKGLTFDVISRQVEASLPEGAAPERTVIAYEPVWAIGTGRTPSESDIAAAHRQIGASLAQAADGSFRILYGGSVKADNAAPILKIPEVGGALVGGASLKADDFWTIVESCP